MIEYPVSRHTAVTMAMRPRESRTGRGERFEAQALQEPGAADVPWIGDGETSCLVQFVKCAALVGNTGTGVGHASTPQGHVSIAIVHAAENSRTSYFPCTLSR